MSWWWVLLVALVVVLVAFWLSWTATRLDRIHHRIAVARGSLDTWLLRRSGAALELATSGMRSCAKPSAPLSKSKRRASRASAHALGLASELGGLASARGPIDPSAEPPSGTPESLLATAQASGAIAKNTARLRILPR